MQGIVWVANRCAACSIGLWRRSKEQHYRGQAQEAIKSVAVNPRGFPPGWKVTEDGAIEACDCVITLPGADAAMAAPDKLKHVPPAGVMLGARRVRVSYRSAACSLVCLLGCIGTVYAFQKPFRQYPGVEYYYRFETPPDANEKTEVSLSRV